VGGLHTTEELKPGFLLNSAAKRAIANDLGVSDAVQLTLAQLGLGQACDIQPELEPEPQRGCDADDFDFGFDTGDGGDSLF